MIEISRKEQCCGCRACEQACPTGCIKMIADKEGFLYPQIEREKCIDCKKCEHVCPIQNCNTCIGKHRKTYVAYAKDDEIRLNSSSGGIFSLIASQILSDGGLVVGAAYRDDFSIEHVVISSEEELYKVRGSKYLQSDTGNTFSLVERELKAGKKVLYSGTGCQIAGLIGFLGKQYEQLYTVDVLCHGAPSPRVWNRYLSETADLKDIASINFRNKETGWKNYSFRLDRKSSKGISELHNKNKYMKLFLSDVCLRPSCHDCKFKDVRRISDLTLGDCWGVENVLPEMDDDKGTSVILVHSEKGEMMLDALIENADIHYVEAELDKVLPPGADSRKSVKPHANREKFFRDFDSGKPIDKLVRYVKPSFWTRLKWKLWKLKRKCTDTGIFRTENTV